MEDSRISRKGKIGLRKCFAPRRSSLAIAKMARTEKHTPEETRQETTDRGSYQTNMNNAIYQFANDDDVPMFWDAIYHTLPKPLTLYVVQCFGDNPYGGTSTSNVFSHKPQHFSAQQYPHQSQQFAAQHFPQTHQSTFPEQLQDDFQHGDGEEVQNHVDVAAEILGIPLNDDANDADDIVVTNGEEDGIRNKFWGMPDPLPCPPLDIKPRTNLSYQPTSHVKLFQNFESKKDLRLAVGLKCVHENLQVKERYEPVCVNDGCEWHLILAVVEKGHVMLQVRRFDDVHTCLRTQIQANNHNTTPQVLGHMLKEELRD
ncbi:hypothetical protein OSB04_016561 [Centaurea solstitialis]|uniref:Transposase MuDR plant domain-containing protein n=1 Tax=Centaurea solstitialis TaxID=347529 RepID=A0AA38WL69_9ASTR|nr:hypothetical protein OSB04_016561 [Centaurea solstitialis]